LIVKGENPWMKALPLLGRSHAPRDLREGREKEGGGERRNKEGRQEGRRRRNNQQMSFVQHKIY